MLCNRLWLMGSIYRYPKMASLQWCLNKLLRKQVISWKRTGEYCQSQESNKGKNSNVRVSSLYFRIWKKTCVTRLEWTPGGLATSHLFCCNHPSLDQFFISLWFWIGILPSLPRSSNFHWLSTPANSLWISNRAVFNGQILFKI